MADEQTPPVETPEEKPEATPDPTAQIEELNAKLAEQAAQLAAARKVQAEANAEAAKRDAEAKAAHEQGLQESKKYKELFEIKSKELADERTKRSRQAESVKTTFKLQSKREAALKAGIREDALGMIEAFPDDELELSTSESGVISVTGAEKWAENLKTSSPFLFKSSTAPQISGSRPSSQTPQGKKMKWSELEKSDYDEYTRQMQQAMKEKGLRVK